MARRKRDDAHDLFATTSSPSVASVNPNRWPETGGVVANRSGLSSAFAAGQAVVITDGMSKGVRGVLVAQFGEYAKGIPSWCVELPDARRVIRQDFLERVGS